MCGSIGGGGGGVGGLDPSPENHRLYRNKYWDPPLENVGPPLDPWKSIVFYVIKPLDPLPVHLGTNIENM